MHRSSDFPILTWSSRSLNEEGEGDRACSLSSAVSCCECWGGVHSSEVFWEAVVRLEPLAMWLRLGFVISAQAQLYWMSFVSLSHLVMACSLVRICQQTLSFQGCWGLCWRQEPQHRAGCSTGAFHMLIISSPTSLIRSLWSLFSLVPLLSSEPWL